VPTVLCIDDDLRTLALREVVLHSEGFIVLSASKGLEGITLAQQHNIDVVVLDYAMPDMNGEELARMLKHEHPKLPIILSSGYGEVPESVFTVVDAFVAKGDAPEFLVKTIKSLLTRKKKQERRDKTA
jgi:CheY-like chemotaxis protein